MDYATHDPFLQLISSTHSTDHDLDQVFPSKLSAASFYAVKFMNDIIHRVSSFFIFQNKLKARQLNHPDEALGLEV